MHRRRPSFSRAARTTVRGTFETGDPAPRRARELARGHGALQARARRASKGRSGTRASATTSSVDLTGRTCDADGNCRTRLRQPRAQGAGRTRRSMPRSGVPKARRRSGSATRATDGFDWTCSGRRARDDRPRRRNVPRIPPTTSARGCTGTALSSTAASRPILGRATHAAVAETPTDGFTSVDAHFGWRPMRTASRASSSRSSAEI